MYTNIYLSIALHVSSSSTENRSQCSQIPLNKLLTRTIFSCCWCCPCLVAPLDPAITAPCLASTALAEYFISQSSVPNFTSLGICTSPTDARAADFCPFLWSAAPIHFTIFCKVFFVNYAWALILVVQITFNLFPRHICKVTTTQTGSGMSGQSAPPP